MKFPGICRDAELLGVHRVYLYLVLSGKAVSHRLMARYKKLKQSAAAAGKPEEQQ